jgi:hypothetical protein
MNIKHLSMAKIWRCMDKDLLTVTKYNSMGFTLLYFTKHGARGSVVVKALCYNPEGRGFDTRWGEFLNLPHPSSRTRPWGLLSL